MLSRVPDLLKQAQALPDDRRLVACELEETDLPHMEALAGALIEEKGLMVLLSAQKEGRFNLLFARSDNVAVNMAELMKATGAKGGGRPEFARGAAKDALPFEAARVMAPHF